MLSALCENLARGGRTVSVIARDRGRLDRLADRAASGKGRINSMAVDYRDSPALNRALEVMVQNHGRPARTICWAHDEIAPDAPLQIAEYAEGYFWQVLGSSAGDPSRPEVLAAWRARFRRGHEDLGYRQIVLGFVVPAAGQSRWLTYAQISAGVEAAIESDDALSIVGAVDPWSERPS